MLLLVFVLLALWFLGLVTSYDARAIDIYSKLLPTEVRDRLARITLGL